MKGAENTENSREFCYFCDYGPLGFNKCPAYSQEERIKDKYCGHANINGVEITNKGDIIIINDSITSKTAVSKRDLGKIESVVKTAIENNQQNHTPPKISILSRIFELYKTDINKKAI